MGSRGSGSRRRRRSSRRRYLSSRYTAQRFALRAESVVPPASLEQTVAASPLSQVETEPVFPEDGAYVSMCFLTAAAVAKGGPRHGLSAVALLRSPEHGAP